MPSKRILYGSHISPPVRATQITFEALGLDYEFKDLDVQGGALLKPEFLKKNPQHTVPTLEDEDGKCVWDSHAIMAYLVRKYGKDDSLYPKDFYQRAVVDQRLHYENGVLFFELGRGKIQRILLDKVKKEDLPDFIKAINGAYELLETFLSDNDFIAGENLTIADFSIVTTLSALICFTPIESTKYPKLFSWNERMKKLPYYDLACTEGDNQLKARFEEKMVQFV